MNKDEIMFNSKVQLGVSQGDTVYLQSTSVNSITTIDATSEVAISIPMPLGQAATVQITVTAIQTGGSAGTAGDCASWLGTQALWKNVMLATLINGSTMPATPTYNSAAASAWAIDWQVANPSDHFEVIVTGEANKVIDWVVTANVQYIS